MPAGSEKKATTSDGIALKRARALIDSGDDAAAECILEELVRRNEASTTVRKLKIRVLLRLGRAEDAAREARAAAELDPSDREIGMILATALLESGRNEEAQQIAAELCSFERATAAEWSMLADTHLAIGEHRRAIEAFDRAILRDPDSPRFLLWKADALLAAGDADSAVATASDLTARFPEYVQGYTVLCRCMTKLGRLQEAEAAAARACELSPQDAQFRRCHMGRIWLAQAQALIQSGDDEAAQRILEQVSGDDEVAARAHSMRSRVLLRLNRIDEAIREARAAIGAAPGRRLRPTRPRTCSMPWAAICVSWPR